MRGRIGGFGNHGNDRHGEVDSKGAHVKESEKANDSQHVASGHHWKQVSSPKRMNGSALGRGQTVAGKQQRTFPCPLLGYTFLGNSGYTANPVHARHVRIGPLHRLRDPSIQPGSLFDLRHVTRKHYTGANYNLFISDFFVYDRRIDLGLIT